MIYKRILLIDDDEDDRQLFTEAVEKITDSAVVTVIDNGIDALKKLSNKEIIADVIFLDLNMPLMKGEEFLATIKKTPELKQIPVVILSTSSNSLVIDETKSLGAENFITKPPSFDSLVNILRPYLVAV